MSSILLFTATPVGMSCRFKLIQAQTGNREKSLARACVLNSQPVFVRERIEAVGKSKRWLKEESLSYGRLCGPPSSPVRIKQYITEISDIFHCTQKMRNPIQYFVR